MKFQVNTITEQLNLGGGQDNNNIVGDEGSSVGIIDNNILM
jgi:hypothetical protein